MKSYVFGPLIALAAGQLLVAADGDVVFKSEVSLARVDAQVMNRQNQALTGLRVEDFILLENGERKEIRNFSSEDMPVDILLLLDVSGSMRPHIEQIAQASSTALEVLGDDDRVAIMVFDRNTRLRLPFRRSLEGVEREMNNLLNDETFDGGTDITKALYEAARYMLRSGRREARRAVVILTDDQTERNRDEAGVGRALAQADTVLSALIAPDAMGRRSGGMGGGRGGGWPGSSWPGGGGGLGGIILGRRGPMGGGGPVIGGGGRLGSAGTSEIARESGGDSLQVDEASALERTLRRLRQRYALYFHAGDQSASRNVTVHLSDAARRRYQEPEVRYRRINLGSDGVSQPDPVQVSRGRAPATVSNPAPEATTEATRPEEPSEPGFKRRRPAVDEAGSRSGPIQPQEPQAAPRPAAPTQDQQGGWRKAEEPATPATGGWRRVKPGEQP